MVNALREVSKPILHPTRIQFSADQRIQIIDLLNHHAIDLRDLHLQAKFAHWNVKGLQFFQLHELFDALADHLDGFVDLVAERVTVLGGRALGTVQMISRHSRLPEYPLDATDGSIHLTALAERYGRYAALVRSDIGTSAEWGDADTADLLTEISRGIDKDLWFLEAHLQQ